jgi:hypothetical protein
MSMLVLHPSTLMVMSGPVGGLVSVAAGVDVSVVVDIGKVVDVAIAALVGVTGTLVTPITTGVGVNMDGVGVDGKNGVGPGRGCIIQPLQDVNKNANRIGRIFFFIFTPPSHFIPSRELK